MSLIDSLCAATPCSTEQACAWRDAYAELRFDVVGITPRAGLRSGEVQILASGVLSSLWARSRRAGGSRFTPRDFWDHARATVEDHYARHVAVAAADRPAQRMQELLEAAADERDVLVAGLGDLAARAPWLQPDVTRFLQRLEAHRSEWSARIVRQLRNADASAKATPAQLRKAFSRSAPRVQLTALGLGVHAATLPVLRPYGPACTDFVNSDRGGALAAAWVGQRHDTHVALEELETLLVEVIHGDLGFTPAAGWLRTWSEHRLPILVEARSAADSSTS